MGSFVVSFTGIIAIAMLFSSSAVAQTPPAVECHHPIYKASEVSRRAKLTSHPEPVFTEEARTNKLVGRAVFKLVLCESGEVTDIEVIESLPYGMTERSIEAICRMKFTPALKDGRDVSQSLQFEFQFYAGCVDCPPLLVEAVNIIGVSAEHREDAWKQVRTRTEQIFNQEQMRHDLEALIGLGFFERGALARIDSGAKGGVIITFDVTELVQRNF